MKDYSNEDYSNEDYSNEDYSNEYEDFKEFNEYEESNEDFKEYEEFKKSIIYLDEPLIFIINNMEINIAHGNIKVNILDYLPLLKKGYTTKRDLTTIFVIYQYLYDINPYTDQLYLKAFNNKIPENYFDLHQPYDIMDLSIIEILSENDLIKELRENYINFDVDIDGNFKLESVISYFDIDYNNNNNWIDILLKTNLKLYVAIFMNLIYFVEDFLNEIDPRNNNNEAYHLAVKIGDNKIIDLVKNKIIELNWLDKQVLIKEFNKYNFLSEDIIRYYQSRKY